MTLYFDRNRRRRLLSLYAVAAAVCISAGVSSAQTLTSKTVPNPAMPLGIGAWGPQSSPPALAPDPVPFQGLTPRNQPRASTIGLPNGANPPVAAPPPNLPQPPVAAPPAVKPQSKAAAPGGFLRGAPTTPPPAAAAPAPLPLGPPPAASAPSPADDPRRAPGTNWLELGKTPQGRPIQYAQFGGGAHVTVVLGPLDGAEWTGVDFALRLAHYFQNAPERLGGRRLVIVPDPNPDGRVRRNRFNARDVDLGRNFPTENWRRIVSGHQFVSGRAAGCEPETQAIVDLLEKLQPRQVILLDHAPGAGTVAVSPGNEELGRLFERHSGWPVASHRRQEISGSPEAWLHAKQISQFVVLTVPPATQPAVAEAVWNQIAPSVVEALVPPQEPTLAPPLPATNSGAAPTEAPPFAGSPAGDGPSPGDSPAASSSAALQSLRGERGAPGVDPSAGGPPKLVPLRRPNAAGGASTAGTVAPPASLEATAPPPSAAKVIHLPGFGAVNTGGVQPGVGPNASIPPSSRAASAYPPIGSSRPPGSRPAANPSPWPRGFFAPQAPIADPAASR